MTPLALNAPTAAMFNEIVPHMKPKDAVVYHTGSLMHDRKIGMGFQRVHDVGNAAYDAYTRGDVLLAQRRVGQFVFEYVAIKAEPKPVVKPRRRRPVTAAVTEAA